MDKRVSLEKKRSELEAIPAEKVIVPHRIPVGVYIQEADALYRWCKDDREALVSVGLSWELVEDLPFRIEALREAQALWRVLRYKNQAPNSMWAQEWPAAVALRAELLDSFTFAFRKFPALQSKIRAVRKVKNQASMIQDLNDLGVIGRQSAEQLEAIGFDMSLLARAVEMSEKMATLLGKSQVDRPEYREAKQMRDRAFTYLKEAVDETREYGRFAFRKNPERVKGYRSEHVRRKRRAQAAAQTEPPTPPLQIEK